MITDLSFIWVGVATRQEVEQQVSARAETSRVTFTIERLKQMLEEGFAAPAESGRRWELDQDVRGEEGLLPTFQLKLIDVTRTTSVDWRFQCNRDDTGAIKMHLTHPLILVIGTCRVASCCEALCSLSFPPFSSFCLFLYSRL